MRFKIPKWLKISWKSEHLINQWHRKPKSKVHPADRRRAKKRES